MPFCLFTFLFFCFFFNDTATTEIYTLSLHDALPISRAAELLNLVLAEMGRTGLMHEIHGGVHLVGGGALLTHLAILAQTILGRPRVVLGRILGVSGLPQATGNPYFVNALGAVKALARDMGETRGKQDRGDGFLGRFKK